MIMAPTPACSQSTSAGFQNKHINEVETAAMRLSMLMKRSQQLILTLAMTLCVGSTTNAVDRPNIVLILSDDQAWTDYGFMGHPEIQTPNLDALARRSLVFDRGYVASPLCRPSLASMVTGLFPFDHGITGNDVDGRNDRAVLDLPLREQFRQHPGLIRTLTANGYLAHQSGKWWEGSFTDGGFTHGMTHGNPKQGGRHGDAGLKIGREGMTSVTEFIDLAVEQKKPFFLWYAPFLPHTPHNPPQRLLNRYANDDLATDVAQYYAMCEWFDETCGELLDHLDKKDVADNTIVLYFNDNGPNSSRWNDGMKGRKGSTDEGGVRSPLFVRWPDGVKNPGRRVSQICGALDLYPTILAATGAANVGKKVLDGKSLLPLWEGSASELGFRMLFSYWRGKASVRTQQFRLDNKGLLFDMAADPSQKEDVSSEQPSVAALLLGALIRFKQQMNEEVDSQRRPFSLGHADFDFTQLPARDAEISDGLKRSSIHPNCSYVTNWTSTGDVISWPVEVLQSGQYEVQLYYTCPSESLGTQIRLSCGRRTLDFTVAQAHDPPAFGPDRDRFKRTESAVKDFKAVTMGSLQLDAGVQTLALEAKEIPGPSAVDFRLLMFRRIEESE